MNSHSPSLDADSGITADTDRSQNGRNSQHELPSERPEPTLDDVTVDARARTPLGALAVLVSTVAFFRFVGFGGLLAGIVITVCWYRLSAEATFAFARVLLAVAVPENPPLDEHALVEGGLLVLLVSTLRRYDAPLRLLGAFLAALAVLLTATWVGVEQGGSIPLGALVLVVSVALLAYGQHRYALVRTGLLESEDREVTR